MSASPPQRSSVSSNSSRNGSVITGSCYCGQISYRATCSPILVTNCHCRPCQKISGAPYIPFMEFPLSEFTWSIQRHGKVHSTLPAGTRLLDAATTSEAGVLASDSAQRTFCKICGTQICMELDAMPNIVGIPRGTLDHDVELRREEDVKTEYHIFTKSMSPCIAAAMARDNLPKYEEFKPDDEASPETNTT